MENEEPTFQITDPRVSIRDLQDAIDEALIEARTAGSIAHAAAAAAGIDVEAVPVAGAGGVQILPLGAGIVGVDVVVAGLAGKVAYDVWKHILLPKLKRKFGEEVLKPVDKAKGKGKAN